jgi:hypothetical protein
MSTLGWVSLALLCFWAPSFLLVAYLISSRRAGHK